MAIISIFQGQCFVAIDPNAFEDGFAERMSELMSYCRNLEPVGNFNYLFLLQLQ